MKFHKVNIVLGDPVEVISIWTSRMLYCEPMSAVPLRLRAATRMTRQRFCA
jgi:hypothetical protein